MNRRGFLGALASIPIIGLVKNDFVPALLIPNESVIPRKSIVKGVFQSNRLKDLYISPEALEDIRNWGIDQVD